jgi:hypothetical protein
VVKSRRRKGGHAACIGEMTNLYRILVRKSKGKRLFGRYRCRGEHNIKMDLEEIGCEDVN